MLKVLIVEDEKRWQENYKQDLDDKVLIISAFTIEEAQRCFAENPDIKAIIMDACVPGDRPTTLPIVRKFRETFFGPMIAASSDPDYREDLVSAGCSHETPKWDAPKKLLEVLGI